MPAVKTGMTPPPMPGMPAPMQPMGGMPPAPGMGGGMPPAPAPNPFMPQPPAPLAGQMPQGQQQQMGSNANRRRKFGDALEGMLGRNQQGLGATLQGQAQLPVSQRMVPSMMPRNQMVAPGTPMMRTPTPRPMEMGGEVDIFGYADGGAVQYFSNGGLSTVEENLVNKHGWTDAGGGKVYTPGGLLYDHEAGDTYSDRLVSGLSADQMGDTGATQYMAPPDERLSVGSTLQIQETPSGRYQVVDTSGDKITFSDIYSGNYDPEFQKKYADYLGEDSKYGGSGFSYADKDAAMNLLKKYGYQYGGDYVAPVEEVVAQPVQEVVQQPVSSITGAESVPGSAVTAGGNFGTGTYKPDPVDPSEINPIDYSQFTGDVGNFAGSPEESALFGPKINIPQSVSQYMTDPVTGGLTTSYGPEMVATSPIGAIKLPTRPVSIDIFDWLSSPTYGTMYSGIEPINKRDGGVVQYYDGAGEVKSFQNIYDKMKGSGSAVDVAIKYFDKTGKVLDGYENLIDAYKTTNLSALKPNESNMRPVEMGDTVRDPSMMMGSSDIGANLGGGPEQYTSFIESSLSNAPASAFDVGSTTQDANSNVRDLLSSLPQSVLTATGLDPNFEADGATGYYRQLNKIRNSGLGRLEKDALLNAMQVAHTAGYGDPDAYNPLSNTMKKVQDTEGYALQKRQQLLEGITRHSADRYMSDEELAIHNQQFMPEFPVSSITGAQAGAGSAVGAGGNFGTGSYTADIVDSSEINPIDYSQFTGDVGNFAGSAEENALFGPKINIPQSVSQYMTDPVTGGLTTSYGPEMAATSSIGAIKLPARPVSIDIFDWLSTPTYGTMYSGIEPVEMRGGGSVPRSTMIADEPHMLAYINQDEESLLRSFGGSGISGPGGIPSYPPESSINRDYGYTSSGFSAADATADDDKPSNSGIGSSGYTSLDAIANAAVQDDDDMSFSYGGQSFDNIFDYHDAIFGDDDDSSGSVNTSAKDADLGVGGSDKTVTANQLSSGEGTTTYDTDDGGSVTVATGSTIDSILNAADDDDGGSSVVNIIDPVSVKPPPVYTDRFGNTYSSQAEADAADRAYAAQLALYGSGQEDFRRFAGIASGMTSDPEEDMRLAAKAYPTYLENFNEGREINIFDEAPFTYTSIPGIGGGPAGGAGVGITPAPVVDPSVSPTEDVPGLLNKDVKDVLLSGQNVLEGQPAISLDAPVQVDPDANDPRGNQIVSPTGTGTGLQSDLQSGLGATDRQTYYGGSGPRDERDMYQAPAESVIAKTIAGFEGRTETPYWDVNANRAGYGSDTKTDPETGEVTKITPDTKVSKAEADADLNRRLTTEFIPRVVDTVGADTFYSMNPQQQAALTSITYNYGKLPDRVASVVNNVDPSTAEGQKAISDAIRSLEGDNDGVNSNRRNAEADLFLGQGDVPEASVVTKSDTGVSPEKRDENVEKIKKQIGDQAEPTGVEAFFYDVIGSLGLGLGKGLADDLRGKSREERQSIIDQHVYALQNGATPKTDKDGNYVGFDISTMDTFADKVLGAEDISTFLPGGAKDADGDGVIDSERFGQVYDAQATAAAEDPYGMSTEQGFITQDGKEFFVDATGKVVEVTDGNVPYEVGGGQSVAEALGVTETTTGDDDSGETKNYTTDTNGNIVCNDEGYVYNPETDTCEPPAEEKKSDTVSSPISTTGRSMRSFEDILAGITTPAPKIAPISANIRPMQAGGMVGLNRAADNFIKALAG